jgi:hypothetical protein
MRWNLVTTLVIAAALPAAGCASSESATTAPTTAPATSAPATAPAPVVTAVDPETKGVLSNGGTYYVEHAIVPDPIPLNEVFGLQLTVYRADARDTPLRDVELMIDGRMPEHRHGMLREPSVVQTADGAFVINGMLFHMPGYWELHFDVTSAGTTERAEVEVTLE